MTVRIVTRLTLLLVALAAATALMVGGAVGAGLDRPVDAASLLDQRPGRRRRAGHRGPGRGGLRAPAPTPAVVLIFAGIVLMAALPPIHRVHVYHRSYHRSDWL